MLDINNPITIETTKIMQNICAYIRQHVSSDDGNKEEQLITLAKCIVDINIDWLVLNCFARATPFWQLAFTMRLLMETVADFNFISKNQTTAIDDFFYQLDVKKLDDIYERAKKSDFKDESKFRNSSGTKARIKDCFDDIGYQRYNFLCLFTHFNNLGIATSFAMDFHFEDDRKHIVKFLPVVIDKFIKASSRFDSLSKIDRDLSQELTKLYKVYAEYYMEKKDEQ